MTTKEAVALLERYSNYDGMGIPNLAGCKEAMRVAVDALKEACPELAESEDERIRKWLIDYFSSIKETVWIHRDITCEQILAYLEKQKEQKQAEWSEDSVKFKEGFKAGRESGLRDGQKYVLDNLDSYGLCKPVEWSEGFDEEVEKIHKRYPEVSFAKLTRIAYHFSKWANRCKDIEWSEVD